MFAEKLLMCTKSFRRSNLRKQNSKKTFQIKPEGEKKFNEKNKKHKENGEKSWLFRVSRQEGLRSIAIQDLTTTAVLECLQAKTVFSRKKNVGEVACCRQFSFGQTIIFFTVEVVVNCENDRVYATRKHSRMYPNTFESGVMFWTPVASNSSLGIP